MTDTHARDVPLEGNRYVIKIEVRASGVAQSNKGGDTLQRNGYRVLSQMV